MRDSDAIFGCKRAAKWRFFVRGQEVDCHADQRDLFYGGSPGLRGTWQDDQKIRARRWVAGLVNALSQPEAIEAQISYAVEKARSTVLPEAAYLAFNEGPSSDWLRAFQALYLAYSILDPYLANQHLKIAVGVRTNAPLQTPDWFKGILRELVFGPKISTYPHRYYSLKPKVEKHFGVSLPDMQDELYAWRWMLDEGHDPPSGHEPRFEDPREVQAFLIGSGYDLGPAGADEVLRDKSQEAIRTFQDLNRLPPSGTMTLKTRQAMLRVYRKTKPVLQSTAP